MNVFGCLINTAWKHVLFFYWGSTSWISVRNKNHQRMMVDPMFMIIQNSRLFLTAVTPTVSLSVVAEWLER